jgi:hypothetical protein
MPSTILLIENNVNAADEIRAALICSSRELFDVERVSPLTEGIDRLIPRTIMAVLLNLSLPDSNGVVVLPTNLDVQGLVF